MRVKALWCCEKCGTEKVRVGEMVKFGQCRNCGTTVFNFGEEGFDPEICGACGEFSIFDEAGFYVTFGECECGQGLEYFDDETLPHIKAFF